MAWLRQNGLVVALAVLGALAAYNAARAEADTKIAVLETRVTATDARAAATDAVLDRLERKLDRVVSMVARLDERSGGKE